MNELNILRQVNGKTYRYGYTTGSCAAAASKAAVKMLLSGQILKDIQLTTPSKVQFTLTLQDAMIGVDYASCSVIKNSGDDPDITNGIQVVAKASYNHENRLIIQAGIGIGRVTKKGLAVAVGLPAINPGPMEMIQSAVIPLLSPSQGITIEISVPQGEAIASKTFNARLGIIGGISILGTSGIVVPMSEEAFKNALALELSMLKEKGCREVILTPGNYGEAFIATHMPTAKDCIITTSNFIGFMLHASVRFEMKKILLVGHIGKLVKVAGGIFHTHSNVADARNEIMAAHYMKFSGDAHGFGKIMQSNTTEEAIEYVKQDNFFTYLCEVIQRRCQEHIQDKVEVEVMIFSQQRGLLGKTSSVSNWVKTYFK